MAPEAKPGLDEAFESDFYKHMSFDTSALLERYKTFVPFFKECKTVLDAGCGRGEFLELLKEKGIDGVGVDSDEGMTESVRKRGFKVFHDDLLHFLETTTERFDGVFAAHFIEHLPPEGVVDFLRQCKKILRPGGTVVLVTPNPASVFVHTREFWRDATHVRPYNLELVEFLVKHAGFEITMAGTNFRNYASPFAHLYSPGNPPYDWPPPYGDVRHTLFSLFPPAQSQKSWHRIIKNFLNSFKKSILTMVARGQIRAIEENFQRIYHTLISLYAPNEIFVVGKLPDTEKKDGGTKRCALSVIIPSWNGKKFLDTCLTSLEKQTCQDFEIFIIENGSTDGSLEYLKERFPSVKVIDMKTNTGFAAAVNAGIKAANSELIFLLNNDTEVHEDCIKESLNAVQRYPDDSFYSCKMINFYNREVLDGAGDCVPRNMNPFRRGQLWQDGDEFRVSQRIFGACAGAAVYKRQALKEVGCFDEDFFAYYEDVDVSMRLQLAGHTCRYIPKAVVYHIGSATTGSLFNPFVAANLARNKWLLLIKNISVNLMIRNFSHLRRGEIERFRFYRRHGHLKHYFLGMWQAFLNFPKMLAKRRKILGSARVSNNYIQEMMMESERWGVLKKMVCVPPRDKE